MKIQRYAFPCQQYTFTSVLVADLSRGKFIYIMRITLYIFSLFCKRLYKIIYPIYRCTGCIPINNLQVRSCFRQSIQMTAGLHTTHNTIFLMNNHNNNKIPFFLLPPLYPNSPESTELPYHKTVDAKNLIKFIIPCRQVWNM